MNKLKQWLGIETVADERTQTEGVAGVSSGRTVYRRPGDA